MPYPCLSVFIRVKKCTCPIQAHPRQESYWQASQDSGFSSEQATDAVASGVSTVALAIRVAGRERR